MTINRHLALNLINLTPNWSRQGYLVASLLRKLLELEIGEECRIGAPIYGDDLWGLRLGSHVRIGRRCTVFGLVHIQSNCLISENVTFAAVNHFGIKGNKRNMQVSPIVVGERCWIGANVTVCPGVIIGAGSIIGAGAVVTKNVPPGSVMGGNPARSLKSKITLEV